MERKAEQLKMFYEPHDFYNFFTTSFFAFAFGWLPVFVCWEMWLVKKASGEVGFLQTVQAFFHKKVSVRRLDIIRPKPQAHMILCIMQYVGV